MRLINLIISFTSCTRFCLYTNQRFCSHILSLIYSYIILGTHVFCHHILPPVLIYCLTYTHLVLCNLYCLLSFIIRCLICSNISNTYIYLLYSCAVLYVHVLSRIFIRYLLYSYHVLCTLISCTLYSHIQLQYALRSYPVFCNYIHLHTFLSLRLMPHHLYSYITYCK